MSTEEIGNMVIEELRRLDQVAYVRFASVYRKFEDVDEFMNELQYLLQRIRCDCRDFLHHLGDRSRDIGKPDAPIEKRLDCDLVGRI